MADTSALPAFDPTQPFEPVDNTASAAPASTTPPSAPIAGAPPFDPNQAFDPVESWRGYPTVAGESAAQHAITGVGEAMQGVPELTGDYASKTLATLDKIDRGEKVAETDDPIGYGQMDAQQRAQARADVAKTAETYKPSETSLYKAGQAVTDWAKEKFPLSPEEEQSITGQAAGAVGSMAPLVAAGMVNPEAALALGATQMGLSGAHGEAEAARAKGASPEDTAEAARMGAVTSAISGSLPLHTVLAPVERYAPGIADWARARLTHAIQSGAVFATLGEAQEWIGQQIAQNFYDPNAGYSPDIKRVLGSFLGGAFLGALTPTPLGENVSHETSAAAVAPEQHAQALNDILGGGEEPPPPPAAPIDQDANILSGAQPLRDVEPVGQEAPAPVPPEDDYVNQAMRNLRATSRTAAGIVDVSSTPGKADRMVEGLTGEGAATQAISNYEGVIRELYNDRDAVPTTPPEMGQFIDNVAGRVNDGIVKPDALPRIADTKIPSQTAAADLPEAHAQFAQEFAARLADPNADPIETAAWVEWRANMLDHFWSDGVGKTSKALAAIPLMRAGLPLPVYPPNREFFKFAKDQPRVDPANGGDAYLSPAWDKFNAYYHQMVQPEQTLRQLLNTNAPLDQLVDHPYVQSVLEENRKRVPTGTVSDFEDPAWQAERVYSFNGVPVKGWDTAVDRLTQHAKQYAGDAGVANEGHAVIVLGPPASGKSTISNPIARKFRAAVVDADDAKAVIPEYHGGLGTSSVHEESSYLAKDVLRNLVRENGNIVLPKVGQDVNSIRGIIRELKHLGYTVDLVHAAATPEIASRRNIQRFLNTGRLVDPKYVEAVGDKPRETAYLLKGEAGDFADVDTSRSPPQIVQGSGPVADAIRAGYAVGHGNLEGTAPGGGGAALIGSPVPALPAHRVTAADGTSIDVTPVVVEAGRLRTSQDHGYDTSLQPRQRDRAASQAQVRNIATNLDPARLGYSPEADRGAPIVGPDGMVESGNGRVMALRSVYDTMPKKAEGYRNWLASQGVDLAAFNHPVLVRQRTTPLSAEDRRAFTVSANQAATLAMSAPERALADARQLNPDSLDLIKDPSDLGSAANRGFIRRFVAGLPQGEQGSMADAKGALSAEGLVRVRNAVLAKAYGDVGILSRIAESTNDEVRSISRALTAAAPGWARLRSEVEAGRVRPEMDVTPDLVEAVERTADLRARGDKLDNYLSQKDAFEQVKATVEGFMRQFYDPQGRRAASTQRITDALKFYAQEGAKVSTDRALLDLPPVEPRDIMRAERDRYGEEISDRGGADYGQGDEADGREVRGPRFGEGSEEAAQRRNRLFAEEAASAQRPTRDELEPHVEPVVLAGGKRAEQYIFPGTERISGAELMRRRSAEPMRGAVPQEIPGGLFGGMEGQVDLEQAIRAKTPARPLTTGKEIPNLFGTESGNEPRPAVRGRAQAVPGGQQPRRPAQAKRPDQLSLFGGPGGGGPAPAPDVTAQQQQGRAETAAPRPGEGVTKPQSGSVGARKARPDTPAAQGLTQAEIGIAKRSRGNYRITPEDQIGVGGPKQKVRGNLDAIRTLRQIEDDARDATPGEKALLVKYVGWGAFAQDMFAARNDAWKTERDALRSLLSEEEYDAAKASTLNAHYTSPDVIRGMWSALAHLGYDGGNALEPAAGVGHFLGLIPDNVAPKTAWTAVELDPLSGRITKALYGGADVNVTGFEKLSRPSNYYDLAISNVPFGQYNLTEKPYGSFPIHDFFFVKSLDKVRPGGMVAFITSRYTMDRTDPGTRRLLGKAADLVGAIRLPGGRKGAFAGNAGTEVTTDVLFLRKKIAGEPFEGSNWTDLKTVQTPDGPTNINEYFADHPDMMLGEMRLQGTMYRDNEPMLMGDSDNLDTKIAAAAKANMPADAIMQRGTPATLEPIHGSEIDSGIKDGAFFSKDGRLYQRLAGTGVDAKLNAADTDRVTRLAGMRDLYNDLLKTQLDGGENAPAQSEQLRGQLRKAYDAFVGKYGPINREDRTVTNRKNREGEPIVITRTPNMAKFSDDPDAWKVASIENYDPETGKAKRADIQNKDVIRAPMEREINGPSDALSASLDDTGGIDLDHIAQSLNVPTTDEAVQALGDLVFQNPDGRKWETADAYLSGNVVKKLEDAKSLADTDPSFLRNVSALEKVQPTPLFAADITAQFGAPWIPGEVYEKFITEGLGANSAQVRRVPLTGEWKVDFSGASRDAVSRFGTNRTSVGDIVDAAMNNRQVTVYDKDAEGNRKVNEPATTEARIKTETLKDTFTGDVDHGTEGWVFQDPDRSKQLEAIFNRTYNNLAPRKFDGSHLTLPGLNPDFATRQHRKDAVWRVAQSGNTLLAHVVGSGKTVTMIASGMEQKRLGLINKPAYVIPNHMLEQFSREFIQAYPNAKILVAQKDEMTKDGRRAFLAKTASNDWDGVIITHDAFGRVNMGDGYRKQFIQDQLDEFERVLQSEKMEDKRSPTVKSLERAKKKMEERLGKLMNEPRKDPGTSFEESGIDFLYVDEAHKFKNLSFVTRMQRVKGLAQGNSQRAEDLFLKLRYMEQNRPGRSAVFATGTPVSNTMAELWTMQRYLQHDKLKEANLDLFDAWANTFGRVANNVELSADGRTFKEVSSFSKFVNVPELIGMYSEIADTKTADMLNLPRPEVKTESGKPGINIVEAEPSSQEEAHIQKLVELAASLKGQKPEKGKPNMLSVVTEGRKVATDGRLISPDFDFNPQGKIAHAVNNISRIYQEGNKDPDAPNKVQMVFLDMGVPQAKGRAGKVPDLEAHELEGGSWGVRGEDATGGTFGSKDEAEDYINREKAQSSRFDLYADIRQRLADKGIPPKEIAAIHDATDDTKKARLFSDVRSGKIRVLLGSTEKMGVGTNVQDQLIAMHHLDAPWKPAEVEQRDGRIVRQGNKNPNVGVYRYVTKRSFDAFMWQKLDTKSKFIGQVLSGAKGSRHAEDIDNPLPEAAEMKAAASGDPRILEHAELDRAVRSLTAQRRSFDTTKSRADYEAGMARSRIDQYEKTLPNAKADAEAVQDLAGDKFTADIAGAQVADRKTAGEAILQKLLSLDPKTFYSPKVVTLGKLSGFDMNLELRAQWDGGTGQVLRAVPSLKGKSAYSSPNDAVINDQTDPAGLMRRFENILANVKQNPARLDRELATEKDNVQRLEKTLSQTWPKQKEYAETLQKLNDLTKAMKAPEHPDVVEAKAHPEMFNEEPQAQRRAPEKIISAAVHDPESGRIFSGAMHHDALESMWRALKTPEAERHLNEANEGYVTSHGRFVDRYEGWDIARDQGQIDPMYLGDHMGRAYDGKSDIPLDGSLGSETIEGWKDGEVEHNTAVMANATAPKEYLNIDGKPAWGMAVDNIDNAVLASVRYRKAEQADFHHNFYLPPHIADRVSDGEATFVWGDERGLHSMTPMSPAMTAAVQRYYAKPESEQARTGWETAEGRDLGPKPGETAVKIGRTVTAHVKPSDAYSAKEHEIGDAVTKIAERMAPQATTRGTAALRQNGNPIWGAFINTKAFPHLIAWSMEHGGAENVAKTVRHEIIHHLKEAGLIRPDEWSALQDAAVKGDWLGKYGIEDRYSDLSRPKQLEEAIAEEFGHWRQDRSVQPGPIRAAFQRLDLFFRRIAAVARQLLGRDATPGDIFNKIETGEIGSRRSDQIEAQKQYFDSREAAQALRGQTDTPEFKGWFGDSKVTKGGKPLVVYHGTGEQLTSFPFGGAHFGTKAAANARIAEKASWDSKAVNGKADWNIVPAFLHIRNPLRITDQEASRPDEFVDSIRDGKYPDLSLATAERKGPMRAAQEAGYDGFQYRNLIEDKGSTSWVPFDSRQIKSATGNSGAFSPFTSDVRAQTPGQEARERREQAAVTPRTIRQRLMVTGDALRKRAAAVAENLGVDGMVREMQIRVAPMAARDATVQGRAIMKEFVNARRQSRESWNKADKYITDNFTHEQRQKMYDAADEESVALQQGRPTQGIGLDRLTPAERSVVDMLQGRGKQNFADAKSLDMVEGEGLPSYAPRLLVRMGDDGSYQKGVGTGAKVVRDVRTLALANAKLEDAIAARRLINSIQEIGRRSGNATVNEGGAPANRMGADGLVSHVLDQLGRNVSTTTPNLKHRKYLTREETEAAAGRAPTPDENAPKWFTLAHPAFQVWRPKMVDAESDTYRGEVKRVGDITVPKRMVPLKDEYGETVFERVPIYMRSEFEGPLRAGLSRDTSKSYQWLMALKGKAMSVIMFSPLIHNQVEWGRALPAAPGKVATFQVYLEGNRVVNDPVQMRHAISGGLVPIGGHGYMQDIVSIAETPNMKPGRSLTAKAAGYGAEALGHLTRIYDPKAGSEAVRSSIDWFGNLWHNTLLWDRIRDLQMGLWSHVNQAMIDKGHDPYAANVAAAHFANRYAGALPIEAMSGIARGIANILLFSRSFTLGNLGAYKDAVSGLPRDAQALIQQKLGWDELQKTQSFVKRKSRAMLAIDAGLYYSMLSALQSAFHVVGVAHTASTLGGMIAGGALGGKAGPYGRLAAAAGLGAAGFGLASVLGASDGTRTLEEELGGYWKRFSDLLQRTLEHPASVIGNPFKSVTGLGSTAENEPDKTGRVLMGYDKDGTGIYMRLAPGKVTEELLGWASEPNEMIHRKMSTFIRPIDQIFENNIGFGRKAYDAKADTPAAIGKNIATIAGMLIEAQTPLDAITGAYQWAKGGPGSDVAGMKAVAPFLGTSVSPGYPGGPELGVLADARERHDYEVQKALPGIRDQIRQGDVAGAIQAMQGLGIPDGLQRYYVATTQNPGARLTKRQMDDFMRYASPDQQQEFFQAQQNRQNEQPHADGGAVQPSDPDQVGITDLSGMVDLTHAMAPNGIDTSGFRPSDNIEDVRDKPDWRKAVEWVTRKPLPGDQTNYRAHGGRVDASNINHNPTEGQKSAGNYAKDHLHFQGLPLTIENAKGLFRGGIDKGGKAWKCKLPAHYGYIKRTEGADGDHVDVYVGPHRKAPMVFVIDQVDADSRRFDEHKAMLGFSSIKQALVCYRAAFSDGRGHERIGIVTPMTIAQFKEWLEHGNTAAAFAHPESEKVSHETVGYVNRSKTPNQSCEGCAKFVPHKEGGPACSAVKSPISADGWCKRFARMPS